MPRLLAHNRGDRGVVHGEQRRETHNPRTDRGAPRGGERSMPTLTRIAGVLAAALLGGCASGAGEWTKPGADEATVAQVYRSCRSLSEETVGPEIGINQDILASRGSDWQRPPLRAGLLSA